MSAIWSQLDNGSETRSRAGTSPGSPWPRPLQAGRKWCPTLLLTLTVLPCTMLTCSARQVAAEAVYVSPDGDDSNQGTSDHPVRTVHTAIRIARLADDSRVTILLKGGESFTSFEPQTNKQLRDYDRRRSTFAFVWDVDKSLRLSTYGADDPAELYGGNCNTAGEPSNCIAIVGVRNQKVVIENLRIRSFRVGAIFVFESEDVLVRNCVIEEIGTHFFPDTIDHARIYAAGVVYPKNSRRVVIDGVTMTNCHNLPSELDKLHGFYCTRLQDSEIKNCFLKNISGSPLKFRRAETRNIYVHDNKFFYTGVPTQTKNQMQYGFVRYSGDTKGGCPSGIVIENNLFHYPFCWPDREDCTNATAVKYSISNISVCGSDACDDPKQVRWINNDFKMKWEPYSKSQE